MTFLTKQGSFTTPVNHNATFAVTGVGFQPKAVIFWSGSRAAGSADGITSNGTINADMPMGFSITDGTTSAAWYTADDFSSGDTNAMVGGPIFLQDHTARAVSVVSLDSDGFTLNIGGDGATQVTSYYLAIAGTDLTNVKVVDTGAGDIGAGTGNRSVTGVGFTPDAVIVIVASTGNANGVGFFTRTTQESWGTTYGGFFTQILVNHAAANGADNLIRQQADFVSMDSDGFTLNWTSHNDTTRLIALCLKGGQYFAGVDTQRTATTGTKATTGIGFQPQALLFASVMATASTVSQSNMIAGSIGGTDGTAVSGVSFADNTDGVAGRWSDRTLIMHNDTGTLEALATLSSMDSSGFTLNWTTVADSTARQFLYFAMAPNPSGVQGTPFQPHRMPLGV